MILILKVKYKRVVETVDRWIYFRVGRKLGRKRLWMDSRRKFS